MSKRTYSSPLGPLTLLANNQGLTALYLPNRAPNHTDHLSSPESAAILELACQQLDEYFAGTRQVFSVPLAPQGTAFQQRVWQALQSISFGETASYQAISHLIGNPKANQAVGSANGKNPISIIIPCHRIIGRQGQLVGYGGGLTAKRALLTWEATGKWPDAVSSELSGTDPALP
ncbi:methylated-DNA--[protein]-cysteine S-methyltransferase [Salinivibrio kushneri]|uniref:methylated-DNA--[protein]-cysteine S-methyltransferase n=1 Tax=Salinivibrio kushneri TaxID=1908198 RepID=UPI0022B3267A|nr:methylated-DNA--[protein]-cysteine S-methyltransferase [Salinivibrio kushneri]WBA13121.1 methylated-DNA--[protein]-cysteine S-methyltransferase [Salinivibrio kushneri]